MCGIDATEYVARKIGLKMSPQRIVTVKRRKPKRATRQTTREMLVSDEEEVMVPVETTATEKLEVTVPIETVEVTVPIETVEEDTPSAKRSNCNVVTIIAFAVLSIATAWTVVFIDPLELAHKISRV
jgi:hypothetical protein